jgi:AcrR family transcriptional regulator
MPKTYSENERAYIRERLMEEAESCLAQYGIRRTTVDELVRRVNIPKGTFYLFYGSKERLLFDVILRFNDAVQEKMLKEVAALGDQADAETLTGLIFRLYQTLEGSFLPRLVADGELEYFMRTLPPELTARHAEHDELSVRALFRLIPGMKEERAQLYSAALRGVFLMLMYKKEIGEQLFDDTLRILIRGVVNQMIGEGAR